jgi:hypothetical protein
MTDMATPSVNSANPPADLEETAAFDYSESAELFTRNSAASKVAAGTSPADADRARSRSTYRNGITYRRFASGAEAIRFAIEELAPPALAKTVLVVNGGRHDAGAIQTLYASADYPLPRGKPARKA